MASETQKLARKIVKALFTNGRGAKADRLVMIIDGPPKQDLGGWGEKPARDLILRILSDARGEEWTTVVEMAELRHAVIEHAGALRDVIGLLERGRTDAAVARLEGAVTGLDVVSQKQGRDLKAKLRREELKKGKRSR